MRVDADLLQRLAHHERDDRLLSLMWDLREGKVTERDLASHPVVAAALRRCFDEAFAEVRARGLRPEEAGHRLQREYGDDVDRLAADLDDRH